CPGQRPRPRLRARARRAEVRLRRQQPPLSAILRGMLNIDRGEEALRVDLAACYRLIALYRWDDLVFTHISARVPGPQQHFLINPTGRLFEEITASSLIKVDEHGEKLSESPFPVNPAGFVIHSAVHAARPDVTCVLHTHTRDGIAVASQPDGLL